MKVMVLVKATEASEAGVLPTTEELSDMTAFNEELVRAGVMVTGEGLHPSREAKRVRFDGNDRTVMDGPFDEVGTLLSGFWIWQVSSMDEAVGWVKRCPSSMGDGTVLEIRQLFEAEDFGDAYTPELREREQRMRSEVTAAGGVQ